MTLPIHPLQTPHSGYHWDGSDLSAGRTASHRRFFEGWYFRVTLPEVAQTFAFMYSIEDPSGGKPYSGGTAQILGVNDAYFCRTFPTVQQFWAESDALGLGHWRQTQSAKNLAAGSLAQQPSYSKPSYLEPEVFEQHVLEGYQATATWHQGKLRDPGSSQVVEWQYATKPVDGWGDRDQPQRATAGWLSYLQIFEPGWQVLMAHGLATGWIQWDNHRYDFVNAPTYAEKNWGGAFPQKWFWINCNAFVNEPELTVTAAGGRRQVLWWSESIGMIGIHYQGKFYEFASTQEEFEWHVEPWGSWQIQAETEHYRVEVVGTTDSHGTMVRVPSLQGMVFDCRDTTHGYLTVNLWRRNSRANTLIVSAQSQLAGLEVGGSPWDKPWHSNAS